MKVKIKIKKSALKSLLPNRVFVCLLISKYFPYWNNLSFPWFYLTILSVNISCSLTIWHITAILCIWLSLMQGKMLDYLSLTFYFVFLIQKDLILMLIFYSVQIHCKMCCKSKSEILVIISLYLGSFQRLWINRKSFNITSPILFLWWGMKIDTGECRVRV